MKKSVVGVIGLGIIGAPVAEHLRRAGYEVVVWNRTRRPELEGVASAESWAASPAEVAARADVIHLFVADGAAVLEVINAMGDALGAGKIILCNATIGHDATLEAARLVEARGAQFLDAPFTGTKGAARNAQLLYYIGGSDEALNVAEPVLKVSGGKGIVKVGAIGQAAVIKVVTNVLSAAMVETLAEMLGVVKAAGIPPQALAEALKLHGIRSGLSDLKLPKMLAADWDTHFSLRHMLKDVRLGLDLAAGHDLPVTRATEEALQKGIDVGWADLDFSILAKRYL